MWNLTVFSEQAAFFRIQIMNEKDNYETRELCTNYFHYYTFFCGKLIFLLPDKVVSPGLVVLRPYRPRPSVLPIVLHPGGRGERAGITEEGEAAAEALSGAQEGDLRRRNHHLWQGDFEPAKRPDLTFPAHVTYLITDFPMFFLVEFAVVLDLKRNILLGILCLIIALPCIQYPPLEAGM